MYKLLIHRDNDSVSWHVNCKSLKKAKREATSYYNSGLDGNASRMWFLVMNESGQRITWTKKGNGSWRLKWLVCETE